MLVQNRSPSKTIPAERPLPLSARKYHGNHFVYTLVSQRAGGLSIGVNLNPDKRCNFDCIYCEIDRRRRGSSRMVHVPTLIEELHGMLEIVRDGRTAELGYEGIPAELLRLKEVAISGDGEPTLCPNFRAALEAILDLRERRALPRFKIVIITNSTGLNLPDVSEGISLLAPDDEVWAKLDAGTQTYMDLVNRPDVPLERIMENLCDLGRRRPIVIQSLFPLIDGLEASDAEIAAYADNLLDLKESGAQISLVQIYSAHRPAVDEDCGHLPLRSLSRIAQTVRERTGLNAEVF